MKCPSTLTWQEIHRGSNAYASVCISHWKARAQFVDSGPTTFLQPETQVRHETDQLVCN